MDENNQQSIVCNDLSKQEVNVKVCIDKCGKKIEIIFNELYDSFIKSTNNLMTIFQESNRDNTCKTE